MALAIALSETEELITDTELVEVPAIVDDFRTADWLKLVKYPELVYQKSIQFLN